MMTEILKFSSTKGIFENNYSITSGQYNNLYEKYQRLLIISNGLEKELNALREK